MMTGKHIMIFGGSGSLGNELIKRYIEQNTIVNYSRDECKHWKMSLKYKTDRLSFIIGDIRDAQRVETSIIRENPHIIIVASALKHIDRCEYAVNECVLTNYTGVLNVTNCVEKNAKLLDRLESVVFVSTDKACRPVNAYGMAKALGEKIMIEKSLYVKTVKFVTVRYGNVLNSRGSIIPILHEKGNDPDVKAFALTHNEMTRFVMTLSQSVDLIEHAICYAESGDIVIPSLISMKVKDLIEIFSEKYNKPITVTGLRPGEKMLESLINETQSMSMVMGDGYYYIKPAYRNICHLDHVMDYNSMMNPLDKEGLRVFLDGLNLL